MKDSFTVTITEKDRQAAGPYLGRCLLQTALERRGYKKVTQYVSDTTIDGQRYLMEPYFINNERDIARTDTAPFYNKSVVGRKFKFTKTGKLRFV